MKIAIPNDKNEIEYIEETNEENAYYQKLKNDDKFQEFVVNGLFNMDDYTNMLNMQAKGDLEQLGKEIIIRQEVVKEINRRIAPIVR